jgi:nucleoside-diphosphate-sugar epimerase
MKIFLTGATGFIGSAIVPELIDAGHQVVGLARSDANAKQLTAAGAQPLRGDLEDLEALRIGAAAADGVIHAGFIHDFADFVRVCGVDKLAIETIGAALAGSDRPFVVTSGTGLLSPGKLATEDMQAPDLPHFPRVSEKAGFATVEQGVRAMAVRLPQVHDPFKQGLVTYLVAIARQKGVSAYVGDGLNRWPAGHRLDAARLYRLALEKGTAGERFHAVGEEGVALREIAEAIGRGLKLPVVSKTPEEAAEHFGWLAAFAGSDLPASSAWTQERLGWHPTGPGLISDLDQARF